MSNVLPATEYPEPSRHSTGAVERSYSAGGRHTGTVKPFQYAVPLLGDFLLARGRRQNNVARRWAWENFRYVLNLKLKLCPAATPSGARLGWSERLQEGPSM